MAGVLLAPALAHGWSLGDIDALSRYGLSAQAGGSVHYTGPTDQVQQMIPWMTLVRAQLAHGHLPLWNPYSGLGLPLVFNWQSAAFSLPNLVGYLFPAFLGYTVVLFLTLVIAGSGVYVLSRVLGLGLLGSLTAATVFELSGSVIGWLGWPITGVAAWSGWVLALVLLVLGGRRPVRDVTLLAVVVAFSWYAGQPESVGLLVGAVVVLLLVVVLARARLAGGAGPVARPVARVAAAVVAGTGLAAPLVLPGVQLASGSVVKSVSAYGALPAGDLSHLVLQDFDGLPLSGSHWFGHSIYPETAVYVGVVGLVLALVAVVVGRRRPEVLALAAVAVAGALVAYAGPVVAVLRQLVGTRAVVWHRSLLVVDLALAVLAGVGLDSLVGGERVGEARRWLGIWSVAAAAFLALLWLVGRGHLPPAEAQVRARSFLWPAAQAVVGMLVAAVAVGPGRRGGDARGRRRSARGAPRRTVSAGAATGAVLLLVESAYLLAAGAPLVSSSPAFLTPTPAEVALARAVGDAVVGFGTNDCHEPPGVGILPDVNVAFGVHELAVYDPITPDRYFTAWKTATGVPAASAGAPLIFCPAVTTVADARRLGVGFVLEPPGVPGPRGAVADGKVGDERLYRIPGAAPATLVPYVPAGIPAPTGAPGPAVGVGHPDPSTWSLVVDPARTSSLRLRLTDVPGWHASVDGRPLALQRFAGTMLEARVPPGRHRVVLRYWPSLLTVGLLLAGAALAALVAANLTARGRRRDR